MTVLVRGETISGVMTLHLQLALTTRMLWPPIKTSANCLSASREIIRRVGSTLVTEEDVGSATTSLDLPSRGSTRMEASDLIAPITLPFWCRPTNFTTWLILIIRITTQRLTARIWQ